MADDVALDADDDTRTVTADPFAGSTDPVVDPDAPSADAPPEPPVHDPDVKIPGDETELDEVTGLTSRVHPLGPGVALHDKTGPNKGVFKGHDVVQAERQAAEAKLVEARLVAEERLVNGVVA